MTLFAPWSLLFLLAVPAIVILYLLRQKYSEQNISSLYLWHEAASSLETFASWRRLRKSLLMILQILIAALLALTLAKPFLNFGGNSSKVVVMLADTSMSMKAEDLRPNRFEAARRQMLQFVSDLKPGTKVTLITMDTNTVIRESLCSDKSQLESTIRSLSATNGQTDTAQASSLLHSITGQYPDSEVYFFGDRPLVPGSNITAFDFSNRGANYAVILLSHTVTDNGITALSRIANYSENSAELPVSLYADGKVHDAKRIRVKAGETVSIYWEGIPADTDYLECRIDTRDSLPGDNNAWDPVNRQKNSRVLLTGGKNTFLEKALSINRGIELFRTETVTEAGLKGYDLYVFDGTMPETLPGDGSILVFDPPVNKYFTVDGILSPVPFQKPDHELFRYAGDYSFAIRSTKKMTVPAWGEAVLKSGDNPVIFAGSLDNRRIAVFGFDLHQSDLALTTTFPILMNNLTGWLLPARLESTENILPGQAVKFNTDPKAGLVRVKTPSGSTSELAPPFPVRIFDAANETGLYSLEQTLPSGVSAYYFAVNPPTGSESDLNAKQALSFYNTASADGVAAQAGNIEIMDKTVRHAGSMNLQPYLLWAVLILILLEWGVYRYDV